MGSAVIAPGRDSALSKMPLGLPKDLLASDLLYTPPGYRDAYFTYVYQARYDNPVITQNGDPLLIEYDADFITWAIAFGTSPMDFGAGTFGPDMTISWSDAGQRFMDNIQTRVQQLCGTMAYPAPQYPPVLYPAGSAPRFNTVNISTGPVLGLNQIIFIGMKRIKDPYYDSSPRKRNALDRNKEIVFNYVLKPGENRGDLYQVVDTDAAFAIRGYKIDYEGNSGAGAIVQPAYRFSDDTGYRLSNQRILLSGTLGQSSLPSTTPVVTVWPELIIKAGGKINIELQDVLAAAAQSALVRVTFIGEKRYQL